MEALYFISLRLGVGETTRFVAYEELRRVLQSKLALRRLEQGLHDQRNFLVGVLDTQTGSSRELADGRFTGLYLVGWLGEGQMVFQDTAGRACLYSLEDDALVAIDLPPNGPGKQVTSWGGEYTRRGAFWFRRSKQRGGSACTFDRATGSWRVTPLPEDSWVCDLSPDGQLLLVVAHLSEDTSRLVLVEVGTGRTTLLWQGGVSGISGPPRFVGAGRWVLWLAPGAYDEGSESRVHDLREGRTLRRPLPGDPASSRFITPDGTKVFSVEVQGKLTGAPQRARMVYIQDLATGATRQVPVASEEFGDLSQLPAAVSGGLVFVRNGDTICRLDLDTGAVETLFPKARGAASAGGGQP